MAADKGFKTCFETLPTKNNGEKFGYYSIPKLLPQGYKNVRRLPVCIRIVLESLLRNFDNDRIKISDIQQLANWQPGGERSVEIPFIVARVLLQDFTGVPLLVDLAAMRSAAKKLDRDPKGIEPLVPVELV